MSHVAPLMSERVICDLRWRLTIGSRRMDSRAVLLAGFGRLPRLVSSAVDGLTAAQLTWAPEEGANTIGWLVWHLTRIQDDHVADLIGDKQIWETGVWAPHFGLAPDPFNTGYGHD